MVITDFLFGKITLTVYIPKIMSKMPLWILSYWSPNMMIFEVC